MEIKKSPKADLERRRTLWFFLAFIVNISIFVFALEYTPSDGDLSVEDLEKAVDHAVKTTEMLPAEISAPDIKETKHKKAETTVSEEIKVVENTEYVEEVMPASVAGDDEEEEMNSPEVPSEFKDLALERPDVVTDLKKLEEIPSYPGGMSKFVRWLTENLHYPEGAQSARLQGTVSVSFIIETDGSITGMKVVRSLRKDCDDEVLRVLGEMQPWTPGKKNGAPCRTLFCIPVEFKL